MDAGRHADQKDSPQFLRSLFSLVVMMAVIVGASFLLREYVIQGYGIPSGSMETTIMTGDNVFSEEVSYYFRDIQPGDIVTFKDPEIPSRVLIKRCIAVGGQTVDIANGTVYIDGVALSESYTHGLVTEPLGRTVEDIDYPYRVSEGHIWVMGDNRTNSQDSRYFGEIPVSSVYGRAFMVYWPFDHFGLLK